MANELIILTDCDGTKFEAIEGVFKRRFEGQYPQFYKIEDATKHKTPLELDNLSYVLRERVQFLKTKNISEDAQYFCSFQRCYIFDRTDWHLMGKAGIATNTGEFVTAFTASVPVGRDVSEKKTKNRYLNMSDLLAEQYPNWNRKTSVYELLTGEDEKGWIQQPLRYCLRALVQ